jgi:AraC-like DNA-binding protein
MPPEPLVPALDLLLRGGGAALLLLLAALLLRDERGALAARLGALFAIGSAAYDLCASPVLHTALGWFAIPILALASGNNLVMFLFASALFDDDFRLRGWHLVLWPTLVAAGLTNGFVLAPAHLPAAAPIGLLLGLQALLFAMLAGAQTIGSWRGDLIEPRRRLRLFIVIAAAGHTIVTALAGIAGERPARFVGLAAAATLAAIAAIVAWSLMRASADGVLLPAAPDAEAAAAPIAAPPRPFDPADEAAVAALERAMLVDRLYRQEGLSIGRLAQQQGLPEYKLRRLINQHLGYRNFADFLNQYRLADAKQALADPAQQAVSILTIALDAGFSSLGPFNRAFKAATGMTPSEYRRAATVPPAEPTRSPIPVAAGRI